MDQKFLDVFFAKTWTSNPSYDNAQTLIQMYQLGLLESASGSCLHDAISALRLSNVAHDTENTALLNEGMARYGRSLKGLREVLLDPGKANPELVLTTSCLISLYEVRLLSR